MASGLSLFYLRKLYWFRRVWFPDLLTVHLAWRCRNACYGGTGSHSESLYPNIFSWVWIEEMFSTTLYIPGNLLQICIHHHDNIEIKCYVPQSSDRDKGIRKKWSETRKHNSVILTAFCFSSLPLLQRIMSYSCFKHLTAQKWIILGDFLKSSKKLLTVHFFWSTNKKHWCLIWCDT